MLRLKRKRKASIKQPPHSADHPQAPRGSRYAAAASDTRVRRLVLPPAFAPLLAAVPGAEAGKFWKVLAPLAVRRRGRMRRRHIATF